MTHVNLLKPLNLMAMAAAMILGPVAWAEESAAPVQPVAADGALETVTVYARRIVPVTHVAATVTVITNQQLQQTLASDVKQMVRYEPGLSVGNDPFRFGLDTFTIRGMTGNRVAVYVDGVPSAPGFAIGSYSNSGRAFVDLALVQRVEILRGPASSLYGSDAIGGVVAMTTVSPGTLLGTTGQALLRTELGWDSVYDGWHEALIGAQRLGSTDLLIGVVHRQGGTAETAADVKPDPSHFDSNSALATIAFNAMPGGPVTLTAEGGGLDQKTDVNAFENLAGTRFAYTTTLKGNDSGTRFRTSIAQQLTATSAYDTARWVLYWQGTDTHQDTYEQRRAVPPPQPGRPGTPPLQLDRLFRFQEDVLGAGFTAAKDVETGRVLHDIVYGLEVSTSRLEELRNGTQTDLLTGDITRTILGETYPLRDFPNTDVIEAGLFAQDEMRFGGGAWSVIPALRVDYYDLSPNPDETWRKDNPRTPVAGLNDTSVSPKLGLIRRFGDSLSAYFQYSHGFRAPPPEDVNIGLDLPLLNVRAIPNPNLKPETSDGYELGLRDEGSAVAFTLSGYCNDYDDFIESKVNLGVDPVTHVILFQSQNIARARIYGTEVAGTLHGRAVTESLADWTARLSAAWSKGEDLNSNRPLNSVDPGSALLSLAYDAPSGTWRTELVTTAVAAKRDVDRSKVNLYRTDGYVTVDLLGQVNLGHGLTLDWGLFNVTNAAYIEWADVRGRPAGDPLIPYYTQPGRNVSVTLHWSL